jgi:hypothetical protein
VGLKRTASRPLVATATTAPRRRRGPRASREAREAAESRARHHARVEGTELKGVSRMGTTSPGKRSVPDVEGWTGRSWSCESWGSGVADRVNDREPAPR